MAHYFVIVTLSVQSVSLVDEYFPFSTETPLREPLHIAVQKHDAAE